MYEDDAEPLAVAKAEYEEWFGDGRDRRSQVSKLVDMRAWERPSEAESSDSAGGGIADGP